MLRRVLAQLPVEAHAGTMASVAFEAAVFVIDISGFTPLTQRAVIAGADSIERFHASVNDFFARVIDRIYVEGGDVVGFAGDAVIAVFEPHDGTLQDAALAAARCALGCRTERLDTTGIFPASPGIAIGTRIALNCGPVWAALIGRPGRRHHLLVSGQAMHALDVGVAPQGGIALMAEAVHVLGRTVITSTHSSSAVSLEALSAVASAAQRRTVAVHEVGGASTAAVLTLLPVAVAERLRSGHEAWLAEMRFVCPLFLSFGAADIDASSIATTAITILSFEDELLSLGGELLHIRSDTHGTTAVGMFGTPGCTNENDALRAGRAARVMAAKLLARGVASDIGVSSGNALCAVFGNEKRCDYGILGDVMNVAARLMQQHDGVLCDLATSRRAGARLNESEPRTLALKGMAAPVEVVHLLDATARAEAMAPGTPTTATESMAIGRDDEQEFVDSWLRALLAEPIAPQACALLVEGEAGMGKSMLMRHLLRQAARLSIDCIAVTGSSTENLTPYFVWRSVLQHLFGSASADSRETMAGAIVDALASDARLQGFAPLLNEILPLGIASNAITRQMEPSARAATTSQLLLHLVADSPRPRLLVFEDAHWIDSASWAVIAQAAARLPPNVFLALTTRTEEALPVEAGEFVARARPHGVLLQGLSEAAVASLIARRLGAAMTAPDVARFVRERSAGNPLFVEELALVLHERGHLSVEASTCIARAGIDRYAHLELPMTVRSAILERIDGLTASQQMLTKVASVIGAMAEIEMLAALLPVPVDAGTLDDDLRAIEAKALATVSSSDGRRALTFRHAITREAVYGMLTPSQQRSLHRDVGEWHERVAGNTEAIASLLAHHFRCAGDRPRAMRYLARAGEHALLAHANGEAVQFLTASLDFEEHGPGSESARAQRRRLLAEAHLKLSNLAACREQLVEALCLIDAPILRGRLGMLVDVARSLIVEAFTDGLSGASKRELPNALLAAQLHQLRAEVAYFEHDAVALLHGTFACLRRTRRAGPSRELATSHGTAAIVLGLLGLQRAARRHLQAASQVAEQAGHEPTIAYVQHLACVCHSAVGDWAAAEHAVELAAAGYHRVGELYRWQSTRMILAYQALHRGHFARIAHYLEEADERDVFPSGPQQVRIWFRTVELAARNAAAVLGEGPPPPPALVHEVELLADLADPSQALLCHGFAADALRLQGQWAAAKRRADLGLAVLRAHRPTTYYSMLGIASIAGTFIALSERERQTWKGLRPSALASIRALRTFAFMVPIAMPSVHILKGRQYLLDGRQREGERALARAVEAASQFGTSGVQAAAQRMLARASGSPSSNSTQTGWA